MDRKKILLLLLLLLLMVTGCGIDETKYNYESIDVNSYEEFAELDVRYNILDTGFAEVVGYSGEGNCVQIDTDYKGHKVVKIADSAFEGCTTLESVVFWAEIEEIGNSAFKNCISLKSIDIPFDTNLIGDYAFYGCENLEDLIIWGAPRIGDYAFSNCKKIKEIDLSLDTEIIGSHAFEGCLNLEEVFVWNDNIRIGEKAFENCPKLKQKPKGYEQAKTDEVINGENIIEAEEKEGNMESESKEKNDASKITMPYSHSYYIGMQYKEVENELEKLGFEQIDYNEVECNNENERGGEIKEIYVVGENFTDAFEKGNIYDSKCTIKVYVYVDKPEPETLTVENCSDLKSLLYGNEDYSVYSNFASKYKGKLIEFDGRIDYVVNYKNYNTRYELLVSAGDYNPDSQTGPSFKFKDVNSFDLGLDTMYLNDEIWVGRNVRIVAVVEYFDSNTGLFFLDPVSVLGR